ncbi:hypothetical protein vseg_013428 [Gypsophila vaccaria]
MSSQMNIAAKIYADALQGATGNAISPGAQSTTMCTQRMAKKAAVDAAAASLRTAHVPTRPRKISAASIAAAATAMIQAASFTRKEDGTAKRSVAISRKRKGGSPQRAEASSPTVASVMTIEVKTMEEQMLDMKRLLEQVVKDNKEKNNKIEDLQKVVEELRKKEESQHGDTETEEEYEEEDERVGSYTLKQLEDLIANANKS